MLWLSNFSMTERYPWQRTALNKHCSGQRSVWLGAVRESILLDSALSQTALKHLLGVIFKFFKIWFCLRRRMSFLSFCTLNSVNSTLNCIIDNIFLFCTNAASAMSGMTIQKINIKTGKTFGHEHRRFKCLIMEAGWAGKSRYIVLLV